MRERMVEVLNATGGWRLLAFRELDVGMVFRPVGAEGKRCRVVAAPYRTVLGSWKVRAESETEQERRRSEAAEARREQEERIAREEEARRRAGREEIERACREQGFWWPDDLPYRSRLSSKPSWIERILGG